MKEAYQHSWPLYPHHPAVDESILTGCLNIKRLWVTALRFMAIKLIRFCPHKVNVQGTNGIEREIWKSIVVEYAAENNVGTLS